MYQSCRSAINVSAFYNARQGYPQEHLRPDAACSATLTRLPRQRSGRSTSCSIRSARRRLPNYQNVDFHVERPVKIRNRAFRAVAGRLQRRQLRHHPGDSQPPERVERQPGAGAARRRAVDPFRHQVQLVVCSSRLPAVSSQLPADASTMAGRRGPPPFALSPSRVAQPANPGSAASRTRRSSADPDLALSGAADRAASNIPDLDAARAISPSARLHRRRSRAGAWRCAVTAADAPPRRRPRNATRRSIALNDFLFDELRLRAATKPTTRTRATAS